jgi:ComF family protein
MAGGAVCCDIFGLVPIGLLFDKPNMEYLAAPLRSIVDFALPPRCPACSKIVNDPHAFCTDCWQKLHFLVGPACFTCDLPLPFEGETGTRCAACIAKPPRHDGIKAAVAYNDISRNVALRLKYGGRIGLARIIANALRRQVAELPPGTLITPVPLHWTRLWWRSFNQSGLIAAELSKGGDTELVPDILHRTRRTPLLRGLSPRERREQVNGAFALNPKWQNRVKGREIALVDDVYTSGATTDACVRLLKKAGAAKVVIYCWARVLPVGLVTAEPFDSGLT